VLGDLQHKGKPEEAPASLPPRDTVSLTASSRRKTAIPSALQLQAVVDGVQDQRRGWDHDSPPSLATTAGQGEGVEEGQQVAEPLLLATTAGQELLLCVFSVDLEIALIDRARLKILLHVLPPRKHRKKAEDDLLMQRQGIRT
jgi:hypothetical protein